MPAPRAWTRSTQQLVLRQLRRRGVGDVQDLAAQRQDGLRFAIAGALGAAAGGIAFDDEDFGAGRLLDRAIGKLAGKAQLACCGLPADFLFTTALQAIFRLIDGPFEQLGRLLRRIGEPMVEGVAHGRFDDLGRLGGRELVLGLALEFGFANENGKHRGRRAHHVFGRDLLRLLAAGQFAVGPEALIERLSQAVLVRAAFSRRNGVAVGRGKNRPRPQSRRQPIRQIRGRLPFRRGPKKYPS